MIISVILLFSVYVLGAPARFSVEHLAATTKKMKNLPFTQAYQIAQLSSQFGRMVPHHSKLGIASNLDKSLKQALQYHNAELDGHDAIRHILGIPKKDRYKYLIHFLRNPTLDLSVWGQSLVRSLVADGDMQAISFFVNNPKIDLSYDNNYLVRFASMDHNMIDLLLEDQRVRNSFVRSDDELESLDFMESNEHQTDSDIAVNSRDGSPIKSLDEGIKTESNEAPPISTEQVQAEEEETLLESLQSSDTHELKEKPLINSFANSVTHPVSKLDFDGEMGDLESLSLSSGIRQMENEYENEKDYDWIDNDVDWEDLGTDDISADVKVFDVKDLIKLLKLYHD